MNSPYTIIKVRKLTGGIVGFYAWFQDAKGQQLGANGDTLEEAIGNLILTHGLKLRSAITVEK